MFEDASEAAQIAAVVRETVGEGPPEKAVAEAEQTRTAEDKPKELMSFFVWLCGWLVVAAWLAGIGVTVVCILRGCEYINADIGLTVAEAKESTPVCLGFMLLLLYTGYTCLILILQLLAYERWVYPYHFFRERIVGWYEVVCNCRRAEVERQFGHLCDKVYLDALVSGKIRRRLRCWGGYECPACKSRNIILRPFVGFSRRWWIQLKTPSRDGRFLVTFLHMVPRTIYHVGERYNYGSTGYRIADKFGTTLFFSGLQVMDFFKPRGIFTTGEHFGDAGWGREHGWASAFVAESEGRESNESYYLEAALGRTNADEKAARLEQNLAAVGETANLSKEQHLDDLLALYEIIADPKVGRLSTSQSTKRLVEALLEQLNPLLGDSHPERKRFEEFYQKFLGRKAQSETDRRLSAVQKGMEAAEARTEALTESSFREAMAPEVVGLLDAAGKAVARDRNLPVEGEKEEQKK